MAISSAQPMRSAEIDILGAVNDLQEDMLSATSAVQTLDASVETLSDNLTAEIANRLSAVQAVTAAVVTERGERQAADDNLQSQLGNGFHQTSATTALSNISDTVSTLSDNLTDLGNAFEALPDISSFIDQFQFGAVTNVEVAAQSTQTGSITYDPAYTSNDKVAVVMSLYSATETLSTLSCTLDTSTNTGFAYTITNSDSAAHTVDLAWVAIKSFGLLS